MKAFALGFSCMLLTANAFASDWPEGAEEAMQDACFNEGMQGHGKDATAEQIRAARAACACYAKTMAETVPFKEVQKVAGKDSAYAMDLSPAGRRLSVKIEMACGKLFEAIP